MSEVCNLCGAKLNVFDTYEDFSIVKPQLGYGTRYDMHSLSIRLCCSCMESIIDSCAISPVVEINMI